MLLCREGASSAAPHKAIWFTSRQLQISLVKQSRCAATTVRAGKLCICQQHPGQRRVARLAPALCSRASGGKSGGRLTQALASEREGLARWVSRWTRGLSCWSAVQGGKKSPKKHSSLATPGDGSERGEQHKGRDAQWGAREERGTTGGCQTLVLIFLQLLYLL